MFAEKIDLSFILPYMKEISKNKKRGQLKKFAL